eukprot:3689647-Prorocentrum_lima.AAC.1
MDGACAPLAHFAPDWLEGTCTPAAWRTHKHFRALRQSRGPSPLRRVRPPGVPYSATNGSAEN